MEKPPRPITLADFASAQVVIGLLLGLFIHAGEIAAFFSRL
jgi:hypothetical protein